MSKYLIGAGVCGIFVAILTILYSKVIKQGDEIRDLKSNQKKEREIVDKRIDMSDNYAKDKSKIVADKAESKEKVKDAKKDIDKGISAGNDIIDSFNRV